MTRDPAAFLDKITASKKLRKYLEIDESTTCSRCPFRDTCKLRDIVPEAKVTSSADVLNVVYMMVKQAEHKQTGSDTGVKQKSYPASVKMSNTSDNLTPAQEEEILRMESARQMKEFAEATNNLELMPDEISSAEEELALYLAGIRLLDGLEVVVPKTVEEKQQVLDMLEASIQEFTTRKKVDTLLRLQKTLDRTCSKSKIKRNQSKGIHELIEISSQKIEQFAKSPSSSEVKG